jgi:hypothetical protein
MTAKIVQIFRKPYFEHLSLGDIKRAIQEFSLPAQLVIDGGVEKLVLDESDPGLRWRGRHAF